MLTQAAAIWRFRFFLLALVWLDFRKRYNRSWLGVGWAAVLPIALAGTYIVVFSGVVGLSTVEYTKTLLLGLAVWGFFRDCAVNGCLALFSHETYIRSYDLPIGLYSLRFVLGYAIQAAFALAAAVAFVVGLDGSAQKLALLWAVVPSLLMIFVAGWAFATTVSFAQVYFHDTKHLLEIGSQMLFFLTPIVYPAGLLVGRGLGWMARINPINVYLELVRYPLATGELPDAKLYLYGLVCTAALVAVASATIWRYQKRFVFAL
ncbi:MAG: ABC transporter permease [Planctomycetes bacterium]|nr:ABC transporter permease [Planctomycetota bacterium]